MIRCFGNLFKPLGPNLSFLGTSLLAATSTFGEAYVGATKQHISLKLGRLFSSVISALMCAESLHFSALP